jgi:SAM-dependent methyltransferase
MSPQVWDAADYAANARFVSDLGQVVLDLLAPRAGERVLDIGCGDGALTARVVDAGASVVGIDLSPSLLAAARDRGIDVRTMDAQALTFEEEFDAVFSNAVLHWMPRIDAVLDGVFRALRPGGRFVGEFGGHGCVAAVCTAVRAVAARRGVQVRLPWYFPTPDEFRERLAARRFGIVSVQLVPRPTLLPSGMEAWLRTFAGPVFEQLPETEREPALSEAVELLRGALCDTHGNWTADYTRLRFQAERPPPNRNGRQGHVIS